MLILNAFIRSGNNVKYYQPVKYVVIALKCCQYLSVLRSILYSPPPIGCSENIYGDISWFISFSLLPLAIYLPSKSLLRISPCTRLNCLSHMKSGGGLSVYFTLDLCRVLISNSQIPQENLKLRCERTSDYHHR